jgi:hypothetical protein
VSYTETTSKKIKERKKQNTQQQKPKSNQNQNQMGKEKKLLFRGMKLGGNHAWTTR